MFIQLMKIQIHLKLLTAFLICIFWAISGKAATVGDAFPIATTAEREHATSAAFDGTNYLVGITGDAIFEYNITAQLVSQTGTLIGSRISIGRAGGGLRVGFDGLNYLMVWGDHATYPDYDIYGQFISKTGSIIGLPFAITQAAGSQEMHGFRNVVYDGTNYFVVFESVPTGECTHVYGQFVTPSGQLLGPPIQINQTECGGGGITIAFDGTKILAVWLSEWTSGGTQNGCYNYSCEAVNVVGQFITKSGIAIPGTLSGNNFWISESPVLKHLPSVSFDGTNYLVVFPEDTGLKDVCGENGCNKNISAYLITTDGSFASPKITVNDHAGHQIYPVGAFDGTNHLVLWTDLRNDTNNDQSCDAGEGTCADIYGQYISTTGALVNSEFIINNDEGNQVGFIVGPVVNGSLLSLINTGVNIPQDSWGDVYGVFLDTQPNKPTLTSPSNGATDVLLTPILQTGSFSHPITHAKHLKTEWQISSENDFSPLILHTTSLTYLTSLAVPKFVLQEGNTYYWRVRFYDDTNNASEWSDEYSFTTLTTMNDQNSNGILDYQENTTVDMDDDGTPDINQTDIIKSLNTEVGGGQMGVSRRDETNVVSIDYVESVDPNTISEIARPDDMFLGLFAMRLAVATPGASVVVPVYFSERAPDDAKWYTYDSISGWVDYSEHTTFSPDRKSVLLELKDGAYGDADGLENGVIIDPGGFGLASWIKGCISNASTTEGIHGAQLTILNLILKTMPEGYYISPILPGTYSMSIRASGFESREVSNLVIGKGAVVTQNFELSRVTQLNSSWNLISLLYQPADTDIASVLCSIAGKYLSVWAYIDGSWKVYDPNNPGFSDLTTMEAGRGYWINLTEAGTLNITGLAPTTPCPLTKGWNLLGYNSSTSQSVTDALASIVGKYVSVWAYVNGSWKVYDPNNPGFSDLTTMEPECGYWINAKEACTWTLP